MLGQRARCKACGQIFKLHTDEDPDDLPIQISLDDLADGLPLNETAATRDQPRRQGEIHSFHQSPTSPAPRTDTTAGQESSWKTYFRALPRVFAFINSGHNLKTCLLVWLALTVGNLLGGFISSVGFFCAGPIILLITQGAFAAFLFNTVHQSANGEDDLPAFAFTLNAADLWSAIILPFLAFTSTFLLAVAPAIAYMIFAGVAMPENAQAELIGFASVIGLALLGLFVWPMLVLSLALGGFRSMFRLGGMSSTIVSTFPAYFCTVLLVYGCAALMFFLINILPEDETSLLAILAIADAVLVYTYTAAMRAVGIYFYSFQSKFDWL